MNLTPLLIQAGLGLVKNSGIGVSGALTSTTNSFSSSGISGAVQGIYSGASPGVQGILTRLPPSFSGIAPSWISLPSGFNAGNVVGEITSQASSLVSGGVKGFTSIMGQASSYAATTFGFKGAVAQASGMQFDDLGFSFSSFQDLSTGGVTGQFPDTDVLRSMAYHLPNLGTMFSTVDLMNLGNAGLLCSNLISQGFGDTGNLEKMLVDAGLDMDNLLEADQEIITNILAEIQGSDMEEIMDGTNFHPSGRDQMYRMDQVLDMSLLFPPNVVANISSLDRLGNKLSNIGGDFKTMDEISELYLGIDTTKYSSLESLDSLVPSSLTDGLDDIVGKGSGPFGNPTATDIIGSASGTGYTDNIAESVATQQDLIDNEPSARALLDYLENNPDPDEGTLDSLVNTLNNKPEIKQVIAASDQKFIYATTQLVNEKKNLSIADVKTGVSALPGSIGGVMNMTGQLQGFAVDPMDLGLAKQLAGMATPDSVGDALQAGLAESKNLSRLQAFGIDPGTKMDPLKYAKTLRTLI